MARICCAAAQAPAWKGFGAGGCFSGTRLLEGGCCKSQRTDDNFWEAALWKRSCWRGAVRSPSWRHAPNCRTGMSSLTCRDRDEFPNAERRPGTNPSTNSHSLSQPLSPPCPSAPSRDVLKYHLVTSPGDILGTLHPPRPSRPKGWLIPDRPHMWELWGVPAQPPNPQPHRLAEPCLNISSSPTPRASTHRLYTSPGRSNPLIYPGGFAAREQLHSSPASRSPLGGTRSPFSKCTFGK